MILHLSAHDIAKKIEMEEAGVPGVTYNVTFEKLWKKVEKEYRDCEPYEDELEYGLGSIYPMPGGLREKYDPSDRRREGSI